MKEWLRLRVSRPCGFCGDRLAVGEVVLAFGAARKLRCVKCAGEAPPEILPPPIERPRQPAPIPMTRFSAGMLPLDWKQRAMPAEREPGEDDDA